MVGAERVNPGVIDHCTQRLVILHGDHTFPGHFVEQFYSDIPRSFTAHLYLRQFAAQTFIP